MYDLKTILLAKRFRRNLDITHLTIADIAMLEIIKNKASGNPVRDATISNGIAYFDRVTASQPLVSLKLNIPVTQQGSGTPSPDNVRDIVGFSQAVISRIGKNLFNLAKFLTDNGITYTQDGDWYLFYLSSELYNNHFSLPLSNYSGQAIIDTDRTTATNVRLRAYKNGTAVVQGETFSNANIDEVGFNYSSTGNVCIKVQIELGSTATNYEAYQGITQTIQFGQTVYSAILDVLTGKLILPESIKTIDENTSISVSNGIFAVDNFFDINNDTQSVDCNVYQRGENRTNTAGVMANNPDSSFCCRLGSTSTRVMIKDTRFTSTDDYKTWLANNPVKIAVKLAEPIEIDLTPTVINTLIGDNVIFADVADITECKYTRK